MTMHSTPPDFVEPVTRRFAGATAPKRRNGRGGTAPLVAATVLIGAAVLVATSARAEVYLNEAVIRGTERAELYNSGPDPVPLDGWVLRGDLGDFPIPDGTTIGVGSYLVFNDLGGILDNIGGDFDLIDELKNLIDRVSYGQVGGAPLPHDEGGVSLCRAPDASSGPPLDPANDALFWTLDLNHTFGAANDVPNPNLGSSIVFNELGTTTPAGPSVTFVNDSIELYNPTGGAIILAGWYATFGAGPTYFIGSSFVPPGGVVVEKLPVGIELDTTRLAYLFTDAGVRVDQVGWSGSLAAGEDGCIGRCPDGAGPSDGYDGPTSGGGETLFVVTCTLGQLNEDSGACEPTPIVEESWGQTKRRYR